MSCTDGCVQPARHSTSFASAMAYLVELTLRAERDLADLYQRISKDDSATAARWFDGLEKAVYSLERLPRRCPVAPESKKAKRRLRHLLYGAKRDVYRVIYEIEESRKVVRVLTIRHAAMDDFIRRV
jgi:toxin ParE1/3/4